jgi:rubrerythrin
MTSMEMSSTIPSPVIEEEEWWDALVEECSAILTEYHFLSAWARVEGYHKLGSRILEDNQQFERAKIYGQQVVRKLSNSLNMSERTIHYAVQFAQKYPDLNLLPMGKNVTWTKVTSELLPENPHELKKKLHQCPQCGFQFP